MASKTFKEAIKTAFELSDTDKELKANLKNEITDWAAHITQRFTRSAECGDEDTAYALFKKLFPDEER